MSQKPDYYEVLGIAKTASVDDIKAAFKKIAMKCHPDMLRNKTDAEKAAAAEKFKWAKEASEILADATKRATYDKYGHQGLENIKASGTSGTGTGPSVPSTRRTYTAEDTFDFFDKRADRSGSGTSASGESAEERRARAAEERRKAREEARRKEREGTPSTPSATDAFNDVSQKVEDVAAKIGDAVLSAEELEKFRTSLKELLDKIDDSIARNRKNGGPKP